MKWMRRRSDAGLGICFQARMFDGAARFNQNLSEWNTSSGVKFYSMFNSAKAFDGDLSRWDVSSGEKFVRIQ